MRYDEASYVDGRGAVAEDHARKAALITGAASGIGAAIATLFQAGWKVAGLDLRGSGDRLRRSSADVADPARLCARQLTDGDMHRLLPPVS